jgi:broad specificity phosphatase PhoE
MYIYLVRHGQSNGNVTFVPGIPRPITDPLTELGRTQANTAASYILTQKVQPVVIITSPYARTVDTAMIIQQALDVPLEKDDKLAEYNPGDWEGMHRDEFIERFTTIDPQERYTFRPPNGESWLDEANRVHEVITRAEARKQTCLVLVSHYDPIKAVINLLTKRPITDWGAPAAYPPGSITTIHTTDSGWMVL